MANTYKSINLSGAGTDDRRLKVSTDDTAADFLEGKIVVGSSKLTEQTLNPGAAELLELDVDETFIDHDILLNFEVDEHRPLDDASTTTTSLWSSDKIQNELDNKINKVTPIVDNTLIKSVGTSGVDAEATGIIVDDSDNVTGINDLTIDGDLTVNGTTTTISSTTLDVTDANITINDGGTQASADTQDAGLTIEMSDATDVKLGYDSTTTSRMKLGDSGDEREIVTISHNQSLTNKTIDVDNNTVSNIETDNLKAGVLVTNLNPATDNTKLAGAQAIKDYVAQEIATKDEASEIAYDNSTSGLTATDVQAAIDETEGRLDTAESSLAAHLNTDPGKHDGDQITYNGTSTLAATDVEAAIDELDTEKYNAADFDGDFDTRLASKSTTDLTEGTNLYHTDERAQDAVGTILQDTEITLTYDDGTPTITANLDTTGRTSLDSDSIASGDEIMVYDIDATTQKKITYAEFTENSGNLSVGDIKEGSFTALDNIRDSNTLEINTSTETPIAEELITNDGATHSEITFIFDVPANATEIIAPVGIDFDYKIDSLPVGGDVTVYLMPATGAYGSEQHDVNNYSSLGTLSLSTLNADGNQHTATIDISAGGNKPFNNVGSYGGINSSTSVDVRGGRAALVLIFDTGTITAANNFRILQKDVSGGNPENYAFHNGQYSDSTYSLVSGGSTSIIKANIVKFVMEAPSVALDVTGLDFANGTVRSFEAHVSVTRGSTYEKLTLEGIQKGSDWEMSIESVGDDTGVTFDIDATGQVKYASTNTGSTALLKFRADTTGV